MLLPTGDPIPPDASLLEALAHYETLFLAHSEGFTGAPGLAHLHAVFAQLQALQRERLPILADAFELLDHVHHAALRPAVPDALTRRRHALILGECMELVRQAN